MKVKSAKCSYVYEALAKMYIPSISGHQNHDILFIQQFANQQNLQYYEVSSKENINVENVVTTLASLVKENSSLHAPD